MKYLSLTLLVLISGISGYWLGNSNEPDALEVNEAEQSPDLIEVVSISKDTPSRTLIEILEIDDSFSRGLILRESISAMSGSELAVSSSELLDHMQAIGLEKGVVNQASKYSQQELLKEAMDLTMERLAAMNPSNATPILERLLSDVLSQMEVVGEDSQDIYKFVSLDSSEWIIGFLKNLNVRNPKLANEVVQRLKASYPSRSEEFLEILYQNALWNSPNAGLAQFAAMKAAGLPFEHASFISALGHAGELGVGNALNFIAENINYIPQSSWDNRGGCFGGSLIADIVRDDPLGALKAWEELPEGKLANRVGVELIDQFVGESNFKDARGVIERMLASDTVSFNTPVDPFAAPGQQGVQIKWTVSNYFRSLASQYPSQALAEASYFTDPEVKTIAVGEAAKKIAETNYSRALALCLELPENPPNEYLGDIVATHLETNFDLAITGLMEMQPADWSSRNRAAVIEKLWSIDPLYAAQFLTAIDNPPSHLGIVNSNLSRMANQERFEEIRAVLNELPPMDFSEAGGMDLAYSWVRKDLESAYAYGKSLPFGDNRKNFLQIVASDMASADLSQAWDSAQAETDPFLKETLMKYTLNGIVRNDPQKALQLAVDADGGERGDYFSEVLERWMWQDTENAYNYVMQLHDSPAKRSAVVKYIESKKNDLSFEEVRAASDTLPAGKHYNEAVSSIVDSWAKSNPELIAGWVNEMQPSDARDEATGALIDSLKQYDYEQAFAWAGIIKNENYRSWKLQETLSGIAEMDVSTAKTALHNADISEAEKQKLYEKVFEEN